MTTELQSLSDALISLGDAIEAGWADNRTLQAVWGWSCPPLDRFDLADIPRRYSVLLKDISISNDSAEVIDELENLTATVTDLKTLVPYLYNGNGAQASSTLLSTMTFLRVTLEPYIGWQVIDDPKAMPAQLAKRVRILQAEVDNLVPDKAILQQQISLIEQATTAAETLPTDLKGLKDARNKVEKLSTEASELYGKIDLHEKNAAIAKLAIEGNKTEADKIVEQCLESYRITTSTGLAGAFDDRASRLSTSMWFWVFGLFVSLGLCAVIGGMRYESLSKLLDASSPSWTVIWLHILLSIVSLAAPVWFAWLATKQIGQRFRLSEDYAFKAL